MYTADENRKSTAMVMAFKKKGIRAQCTKTLGTYGTEIFRIPELGRRGLPAAAGPTRPNGVVTSKTRQVRPSHQKQTGSTVSVHYYYATPHHHTVRDRSQTLSVSIPYAPAGFDLLGRKLRCCVRNRAAPGIRYFLGDIFSTAGHNKYHK